MRHSSVDLTMNTYTDPRLLDVWGALEALPSLPLEDDQAGRQKATGTCDDSFLAPNLVQECTSQSTGGKSASTKGTQGHGGDASVSDEDVIRKEPLSFPDSGSHRSGRLDFRFGLRPCGRLRFAAA